MPPSVLFEALAAGTTWPAWSPVGSFSLEREGRDGGESVGAIRVFKTGTVRSREEILELVPDRMLRYRALSGLPLRNHEASVVLDGEQIRWREQFDVKFPGTGWLLELFLRRFIQRCADGLATYGRGA